MTAETYPCIICGAVLERAEEEAEAQPNDGLMCLSFGNYGSTVFDPDDYSFLAFNICDPCMVERAKLGRVMVTRSRVPIVVFHFGLVGHQWVDRPYVEWNEHLPGDDGIITVDEFELESFWAAHWHHDDPHHSVSLKYPLEVVARHLRETQRGDRS